MSRWSSRRACRRQLRRGLFDTHRRAVERDRGSWHPRHRPRAPRAATGTHGRAARQDRPVSPGLAPGWWGVEVMAASLTGRLDDRVRQLVPHWVAHDGGWSPYCGEALGIALAGGAGLGAGAVLVIGPEFSPASGRERAATVNCAEAFQIIQPTAPLSLSAFISVCTSATVYVRIPGRPKSWIQGRITIGRPTASAFMSFSERLMIS